MAASNIEHLTQDYQICATNVSLAGLLVSKQCMSGVWLQGGLKSWGNISYSWVHHFSAQLRRQVAFVAQGRGVPKPAHHHGLTPDVLLCQVAVTTHHYHDIRHSWFGIHMLTVPVVLEFLFRILAQLSSTAPKRKNLAKYGHDSRGASSLI